MTRPGQQSVQELERRLQGADAATLSVLERSLAFDDRKGVQRALAAAKRRVAAEQAERDRVHALYRFDEEHANGGLVLGLDEVGRGPIAGPLAVGGVVLPSDPEIAGLNDSKQIPESKRAAIAEATQEHALAWTVQYVEPAHIDACGITASLRVAFTRAIEAIEQQGVSYSVILLDGNPLHLDPREQNIVKGDSKSAAIAAASIVAKVGRDAIMTSYASRYPAYGFDSNKGYGSAEHAAAIRDHGLCPIHRRSFCSGFLQESLF